MVTGTHGEQVTESGVPDGGSTGAAGPVPGGVSPAGPAPDGAKLGAAEPGAALLRLVEVMDTLRVSCPWDAKQTHESLAPYLLAVRPSHHFRPPIVSRAG